MQHRKLRDISPPEPGVRERLLEAIKKEPRLRSAPNLVNLGKYKTLHLVQIKTFYCAFIIEKINILLS